MEAERAPGRRRGQGRTRRVLLLLGEILFAIPAIAAEPEKDLMQFSLFTAVERAVAQFPSIRASEAAREEARAAVGEAEASLFPSLKLNASVIRFEEPMVVTPIHGFAPGQIPLFDETLVQGGIFINYILFDGGGR